MCSRLLLSAIYFDQIAYLKYTQTCIQRPPLGPQKSGRCGRSVEVFQSKLVSKLA